MVSGFGGSMKTSMRSAALASAAIIVLLSGTTAAFASTPQTLSLTIPMGGVTNLGTQTYTVSGGQVVYAMVNGQALNPGAKLSYSFVAIQDGFSTSGWGNLYLTGTIGGTKVDVNGYYSFDSIEALAQIGPSELPGFFISSAPNIMMNVGGSQLALSQPFAIETPYANPFGGPIVMSSADGASLVIVATYSTGDIFWQGTQLQGAIGGTLGSTPASGMVTLTGNEQEDLVAGTAADSGTISFTGMTPSSLDVTGTYQGSDYIPAPNPAYDCSSYTGFPGTCVETGFMSQGTFKAGDIRGAYSTTWSTPALAFYSTIQATVSQSQNGYSGFNGYSGLFGFLGFFQQYF